MSAGMRTIRLAAAGLAAATAAVVALAQCGSAPSGAGTASGVEAWGVVYRVLQHPRCVNCHPAGDAPLQGEQGLPHAQNVQRGPEGRGLYALRCDACHQDRNLPGANLPPGAPRWQLPHPDLPLVFEGRTSAQLARQLKDPKQNGNRTPAQLLVHMAEDPLVLWGWDPGPGRTPVPVPHAEFVAALRTWIEAGCPVPE